MLARDARNILIPILLLAGLLAGLVALFESRYQHLTDLSVRITRTQDRQKSLGEFRRLMSEVEASQRGFLVAEDSAHLALMRSALPRIGTTLRDLGKSYARDRVSGGAEALEQLSKLSIERLTQLQQALELYAAGGPARAAAYIREGQGLRTSNALRDALRTLDVAESERLVNALSVWLTDLRTTRWAMGGAALLNALLLAWLGVFLFREMRRKSRESSELQRLVDARTTELATLSSYLQNVAEREKQALSRELHDSLGGLLVATKMDVVWLRRRLRVADPELEQRFERIQEALDRGVDLKRRIVENLRPTLLDSMGLFAALRWQFDETCARAGLICTDNLPAEETPLLSEAAIALFRVAQESFTNILKHSQATAAELDVAIQDGIFVLSIRDNGRGMTQDEKSLRFSHGLSGMRHRIQALGGRWRALARERGGTEIRVEIPLANVLAQETGAGEPSSGVTPSGTTPRGAVGAAG
ncbi:MAG TPA: CHASE3 domain-containing protein [Steroidobacteraceae bacterium]|nr:CHASE3 domain-containing protein [Steroidobacteraceae bacterium]